MHNPYMEETYYDDLNKSCYLKPININYYIFHCIMSIIAVFLAVTCNKELNIISLIAALFFPYLYIIYSLIYHKGICCLKP
uniref:Uncharacterized protein n=1 Tax=viral metagenome TaxID=1070528 RepID=A0A6C0H748_9ZZZZ